MSKRNETLTHVYGIGSLIFGAIGVYFLIQGDSTWKEYALVGSGWLAAFFYGIMLINAFTQARSDGEEIGELRQTVKALQKELDSRNMLLEFLTAQLITQRPVPRQKSNWNLQDKKNHD